MDLVAEALGMDPLAFRLKNLNEVGNPDTGKPFSNPGLRDCISMAADRIGWKQKWHPAKAKEVRPGVFHGVGLAAHACSHGAGGQPATGTILLNPDGSIEAVSGSTEIGGGERTQMRMIAAEALGVPYETVSISPSVDTDVTTDTGVSGGSQQTNSGGWGMYDAAMDARKVSARPLVLYYCFMNLVKAFCLHRGMQSTFDKAQHGIAEMLRASPPAGTAVPCGWRGTAMALRRTPPRTPA